LAPALILFHGSLVMSYLPRVTAWKMAGSDCAQNVAVQVAFESKLCNQDITLHAQGGLKPGGFELRVNWIQLVQPHQNGGTPDKRMYRMTPADHTSHSCEYFLAKTSGAT
jgi:hypothetical protein